MDLATLARLLRNLPFRRAAWLLPVAMSLHCLEGMSQLPDWFVRYTPQQISFEPWLVEWIVHLGTAVATCAALSVFPGRLTTFLFLSGLGAYTFWNAMFHVVTTSLYGVYSPGLLTGVLLYFPLWYSLNVAAHREGVSTNVIGLVSFAASAVYSLIWLYGIFG